MAADFGWSRPSLRPERGAKTGAAGLRSGHDHPKSKNKNLN
jgi:hypothetical protein